MGAEMDFLYPVVGNGCCLFTSLLLRIHHFLAGFLLRLPNTVPISQVVVEAGVILAERSERGS